jgi:hypothetical protein
VGFSAMLTVYFLDRPLEQTLPELALRQDKAFLGGLLLFQTLLKVHRVKQMDGARRARGNVDGGIA